jgi:hypothetical protein
VILAFFLADCSDLKREAATVTSMTNIPVRRDEADEEKRVFDDIEKSEIFRELNAILWKRGASRHL